MRSRPSRIILAAALIVVAAFTSTSQTNGPAGLILPPADWDARTHLLASLLTTNQAGEFPLPRVWVGMEKVTAQIGSFRRKEGGQTNLWLEFDKLTVGRQGIHPKQREDRFIISRGEKERGVASFYRASLPSDSELLGMRDFQSVSNLFGWNPYSHPFSGLTNLIGEDSFWISIRYFALRPYDAIETVQVTFMKRGNESQIDNIRVSRSRLHPKPKDD